MTATGGDPGAQPQHQLLDLMLETLIGPGTTMKGVYQQAMAQVQEQVVGPATEYRRQNPGAAPFAVGPVATEHIAMAMTEPARAQGLIHALLEYAIAAPEVQPAPEPARPAPGPSGFDWEALRAERDSLADKLVRRERQLDQATARGDELEKQRDVEARNGSRLVEELKQRDARIVVLGNDVARWRGSVDRLDAEVARLSVELEQAQGRLATVEEELAEEKLETEREYERAERHARRAAGLES